MWKFFIIVVLGLAAACSESPVREDTTQVSEESVCPEWKIAVVEDDRVYCTDPTVLEREREVIEGEEHW